MASSWRGPVIYVNAIYPGMERRIKSAPTAQKPHPPLWMGAGSAASIRKVAALGYNLLLDQYASIEQIRERIAIFKALSLAQGRGDRCGID